MRSVALAIVLATLACHTPDTLAISLREGHDSEVDPGSAVRPCGAEGACVKGGRHVCDDNGAARIEGSGCHSDETCCKMSISEAQEILDTKRGAAEAKAEKKERRALATLRRLLPETATGNAPMYQEWLRNIVDEMSSSGLRSGRSLSRMAIIHERTLYPGKAKFPNKNGQVTGGLGTCNMYPLEIEGLGYSTPRFRQKNKCDIKSMRKADICATDNPVAPMSPSLSILNPFTTPLFTLWESRYDANVLSQFLCPREKQDSGKDWSDSLAALKNLGVWTYGGEAESKKIGIQYRSDPMRSWRRPSRDGPKDGIYNTHLILFMKGDEEYARMESESNSGLDSTWFVEFVTSPVSLVDQPEQTRAQMVGIYDAMEAVGAGTLKDLPGQLSSKLFKKYGIKAVVPSRANHGPPDGTHDNWRIYGMETIRGASTVCQGNYMMRLQTTFSGNHFSSLKSTWDQAANWATKVVGLMKDSDSLSKNDRKDLEATLAIHIYNSYWFHNTDTKKDTKKDRWEQLPKTPVLDLVRALPSRAKEVLLAWVKS